MLLYNILDLKKDFYYNLIHQAPIGFAHHKVILDKNNEVVDYIFLEINAIFEELTGLHSKDIINKPVTEVVPGIKSDEFNWISFYGDIAMNGGEKEFEQYSAILNKHYKVQVFSTEKGYFITLFSDVSERVHSKLELSKILESSELFIKSPSKEPEYQKILDLAREFSGAKYAVFNKYTDDNQHFKTHAFSGIKDSIKKIPSIMGYNPLNKIWDHDPIRAAKIKDNTITCFNSLKDLSGDVVPSYILKSFERIFQIKKSAIIKIADSKEMLGDITLIFTQENIIENREILEIFAGQVFMYLNRYKTEESLKNSKNRLNQLLQNAGEGIIGIDINGDHTFVNPQAVKILGYTEEEMIGVNSHKLWHHHHEDGSEYVNTSCPIYNTIKRGKEISKAGYFIHKDGHGIYVNYTSMPIYEDGKISGAVVTFIDITSQKLAEKQIALLASALKSVSESVSITDLNNKIIFVNDSFLNTYGYESDEVLGKEMSFFRSDDNDPKIISQILPEAMKMGWEGELLNRRKDGSTFPILLSASAIKDEKNDVFALIGVARDITEQKKAEQTILQKNRQLEQLVATRNKFFSIISHDLRSPFSAFLGLTELLANDNSEMEATQKAIILKSLNNSAIKFYDLLEDLLQWSRIQQGNIPFDPKSENLKFLVEKSIENAQETAISKEIKLVVNIPIDFSVTIDVNMIQLVIRNLVSNAIKYTNKGGQIFINAKIIDSDNIEVEVKDNGTGMKNEILDNLFNSAIKTNIPGTEGEKSSGLGLLLAKEFVGKNGGTIRVESIEGKGSSFYFTLKSSRKAVSS